MQPDRISIPSNEFIGIHAISGRRPFDSLLFAVDEDRHVLLPSTFFFGLLGSGKFSFGLAHNEL